MGPMSTLAVVGLGAMGSRIGRRLLAADHQVVVWNRDPAKTVPLQELGAVRAGTPAAAAGRADAVIIMVSDPEALREVTEGPSGISSGATPSTTVIQMSTVGPSDVTRLASVLPEGAGLLDAPVLGSLAEVEAGALRIFVGGSKQLVDRWTAVLSALGSVVHTGPLGAGTAAKLVANSTLFGTIAILGEALGLAQALGLPRDAAFDVLAATPLATQAERRRVGIESGRYPRRFGLSLARKDMDLILGAAGDLRLAEAARSWLRQAEAAGLGGEDYSAVLGLILARLQPGAGARRSGDGATR